MRMRTRTVKNRGRDGPRRLGGTGVRAVSKAVSLSIPPGFLCLLLQVPGYIHELLTSVGNSTN